MTLFVRKLLVLTLEFTCDGSGAWAFVGVGSVALEHSVTNNLDLLVLRFHYFLGDEGKSSLLHLLEHFLLLRATTRLKLIPWFMATDQTEEDVTQRKDVYLLGEIVLLSGFFRRSPLWVGILSGKATRFARLLVVLQRNTNVEIVELERFADNDYVGGVNVEMDEAWLVVAIDAMHIGQAGRDISSNFKTLEWDLLGLIGKSSKSGTIGIL